MRDEEDLEERRRRREDPFGRRSRFFGIVVLVLAVTGLYSWLTGVDVDLDVNRLVIISVVVGLIVGLIVIIGALQKHLGSESSDERPPALQGNTGCAVVILVVAGFIGLMVLIARMRNDAGPDPVAPAVDVKSEPVERSDPESAPPAE